MARRGAGLEWGGPGWEGRALGSEVTWQDVGVAEEVLWDPAEPWCPRAGVAAETGRRGQCGVETTLSRGQPRRGSTRRRPLGMLRALCGLRRTRVAWVSESSPGAQG